MSPEPLEPDTQPLTAPTSPVQTPAPSLSTGTGAIIAALIGFAVPVLGMVASCVGIWLGIIAVRRGRSTRYIPSVTCGVIGIFIAVLGIVYWVCVVLFESYR
jgi:hypothetical protein